MSHTTGASSEVPGIPVIAEFASPVDAIVAAVEFQRNLRDRNTEVSPEDRMQFRVGLNLGDVIVEGDNLYGDGVNVAARLEPLAEPGDILVSGKFYDEVRRKLDLGFYGHGGAGDEEHRHARAHLQGLAGA